MRSPGFSELGETGVTSVIQAAGVVTSASCWGRAPARSHLFDRRLDTLEGPTRSE